MDTWEPKIAMAMIGGESCKVWQLLWNYVHCFSFDLKELDKLKGQKLYIALDDDIHIFQQPYRLNYMEHALVKTQIEELLEVKLVEIPKRSLHQS